MLLQMDHLIPFPNIITNTNTSTTKTSTTIRLPLNKTRNERKFYEPYDTESLSSSMFFVTTIPNRV